MTTSQNDRPVPAGTDAAASQAGAGTPETAPSWAGRPADPRRWKALAVLGLFQFMLILDVTVVNIALPSMQRDLGFRSADLAWVVNGYIITAGGLLLLGGRLADIYGRRRLFLAGVVVFGLASVASGAAQSPGMLIVARFAQGTGEAMAAPAALGMIALLFMDPAERGKAFGVWGGLAGLGGVVGNIVSGTLVDLVSWRWIFFINIPVVIAVYFLVPRVTDESRMERLERRADYTGALASTLGLLGIVYGLLQVVPHSWTSAGVIVPILAGLALVGFMLWHEGHSATPLIPLSFFRNRTRLVANLTTLISTAGFFTYAFLLTLFEQQVLGYSPLTGGLSYLPFAFSIGAGIGLNGALMPRIGVRGALSVGLIASAIGLFLTSMIDTSTHYAAGILPGMIVLGLGTGLAIPAAASGALHEVDMQNSSLASGVQNVMQQVGAALGIALLAALAYSHTADELANGTGALAARASGYALALGVGAALMLVSGVLAGALLGNPKAQEWGH